MVYSPNRTQHPVKYRGASRIRRVSAAAAVSDRLFDTSDKYDRPIGTRSYDRTLPEYKARNLNQLCWQAYKQNPIIWGAVELVVRATVGKESKIRHNWYESQDQTEAKIGDFLQTKLEQWWYSPINNWPSLAESVQRDEILFGELVPIYLTNAMVGDVEMGFIDVNSIKEIMRDPLNTRRIIGIKVSLEGGKERVLQLVRKYNGEPFVEDKPEWFAPWQNVQYTKLVGKRIGEVNYWGSNITLSSLRGQGDFAQVIDPARDAVRIVKGITDRLVMNNRVWSHFKFPTNWTQEQINDALTPGSPNYINPPRLDDDSDDVKVFGTSKDLEWEVKSPAVQSAETVDVFKMALALFSAGSNIPLHWMGWADELTYASAKEIGALPLQYLQDRQNALRHYLRQATDFQLDQWRIFTTEFDGIDEKAIYDYRFELPTIDSRTIEQLVTVMKGKVDTILAAKMSGAIDEQTAQEKIKEAMDQGGL